VPQQIGLRDVGVDPIDRSHRLCGGATVVAPAAAGQPRSLCDPGGLTLLSERVCASTEVVQGDVFDPQSLASAFKGVESAYYFVHSMGDNRDFESQDRMAAENFAKAATEAGVRQAESTWAVSAIPMRSSRNTCAVDRRQETFLRAHHAQVVEFRASIVIGSGSLSFEMIRALVERLPIMICPRWVQVRAQPIAIEDLLAYLVAARKLPPRGVPGLRDRRS
jgi:uncharacterized protein YbjT (DUF2867 family)